MALKPVTVSQLNEYISRVVGTDPLLSNVTVKGEASGVKYHSSGHVHFSLVDAGSKVNCFLSRNNLDLVKFQITDGMELVITGGISIYKQGGTYSLFVRNIEVSGEGSLAIAFEQMKQRLAAEGLFEQAHKKPLPAFPRKIGVVTSSTGAAIRDILKIIRSRNDVVDVLLFPAQVQGEGAGDDIARAVRFANFRYPELDVLIVGRGGGSAEDLWAFNEEVVARAIYDSAVPVISAVGHEIDFSISDLVADVRAETPTAAAQIAVPDTGELARTIQDLKASMDTALHNSLLYQKLIVQNLAQGALDSLRRRIDQARSELESQKMLLTENDPRRILAGGYAIVEDCDGRVMTDAEDMVPSEEYKVTLAHGQIFMVPAAGGENDG